MDQTPIDETSPPSKNFLDAAVFNLRWAMVPFIACLVGALVVLCCWLERDVTGIFSLHAGADETLVILSLFDKFMVATLLITTSIGSYHIYIRPFKMKWLPKWLKEMTPKELKIVTYYALAGVSAINLLEDLHKHISWLELSEHLAIHYTLLLSPMIIIWAARSAHVLHETLVEHKRQENEIAQLRRERELADLQHEEALAQFRHQQAIAESQRQKEMAEMRRETPALSPS